MIKDLSDNHLFNNYPCEAEDAKIESLRQQLADSQKHVVLMREKLSVIADLRNIGKIEPEVVAFEALAIQPDDSALKDVVLCHAEPIACRNDGRCQYAIDHGAEDLGHCPSGKCCMPLYAPKGMP